VNILEADGVPVQHEKEPEPVNTGINYHITISRPINGIPINGDEYLPDDNGAPLKFNTIKEVIRYLVEHNCEIRDLLDFDFNIEEAPCRAVA
jgi:hypothetical protein